MAFGLRVTPSRAQTYQAQYRKGGRARRVSTGRHGKITVDEARKLAKEVMGHVARSENPAEDRIGKARAKYRLT
ncbi:Arm DNA-binding domain-containing protein [Parasedimentitalea psychrophila]|uniref:Arm DNA-binding domain-containing protein n=1 Tax=Parasedimentitalea psychrophila TaxID=2997337 RepID=UPI0022EAD7E4|nr:Arm DNA-binding domain-containing protein [Parasedimentitalea psychrophila]